MAIASDGIPKLGRSFKTGRLGLDGVKEGAPWVWETTVNPSDAGSWLPQMSRTQLGIHPCVPCAANQVLQPSPSCCSLWLVCFT